MLLRFGVENHRSIRDRQEISLARSALAGPEHATMPAHGTTRGVLPVLAVYGANASGKSNVLWALERMIGHVVDSHVSLPPTAPMPHDPFRLDDTHRDAPSRFDIDVVVDGVHYHYGFALTAAGVDEEWLYAWPERHKQLWFHRQGPDRADWHFGPALTGQRARIAELTRDNSLFLSAAAQNNHPKLLPLYQYFQSRYAFAAETPDAPVLRSRSPLFEQSALPRVLALLRAADVGVVDAQIVDRRDAVEAFLANLRSGGRTSLAELFEHDLADAGSPHELVLGHAGAGGAVHWLPSRDESAGTVALLNHLHHVLPALDTGGVLAIDELDRALHSELARALVGWFTDPTTNPHGAQLLFTTHDQALLDVLRRDEILVVDKDAEGATRLTPMSDFKTRSRDNVRVAYAEGRYGGVPHLAGFERSLRGSR